MLSQCLVLFYIFYFIFFFLSGIIDEDHNVIDPHLYTEEFVERMNAVDWTDLEIDDNFSMTEFQKRTGHQLEDLILEVRKLTYVDDR